MKVSTTKFLPIAIAVATLAAPLVFAQTPQPWMSGEVGFAWRDGYKGQRTTVTVIDEFKSGNLYKGALGKRQLEQHHGAWVHEEANMIAPLANFKTIDVSNENAVQLDPRGLNTINLSYVIYAKAGYTANQIGWSAREQSIIHHARIGNAVISKAAGNDYGTAVGSANADGQVDYLNSALINTQSAIFVGALDRNGSIYNKANIALYSNVAGENLDVQKKFLVVGVTGGNNPDNKLDGTSFAAPIISGYSAILGSKFTTANANLISRRLINTARKDTIANYSASIHGMGEASIARALSPVSIR